VHDPSTTRAVLVAVDDYQPAEASGVTVGLKDTVERLAGVFTDAQLLGLAPQHCTVLRNPPDAATVLDAVYEAAAQATGSFILYVSGYTLVTPRHPDLYFALSGSSESRLYRALRFPDLAALVRDTGRASDRIVILDYCYDGRTPPAHATGPGGLALEAVPGASVLAANAQDPESWVPPGQPYTAFTGSLIRAAQSGLADAGDSIDLAALHQQLGRDLSARRQPAPRLWPGQGERSVALVRNALSGAHEHEHERERGQEPATPVVGLEDGRIPRQRAAQAQQEAASAGRPAAEESAPQEANDLPRVPAEQAVAMAMPAPDLAEWLMQLRTSGWPQVADDVLAGVAGHGQPANVALLLIVLRLAGRDAEADRAAAVVGRRPAAQCADVALDLAKSGYREECDRLLNQAARLPHDRVDTLVQVLAGRGAPMQAALVFAEAAGNMPAGAPLDPLAQSLTRIGGPDGAGELLAEATSHWPEGRVLTLAEQLDAAGAVRSSFALYARAAQLAAGNWPSDRFADLLRRMAGLGAHDDVETMLGAAEKAVGPFPSMTAYLATALASSQALGLALRLLERTVSAYSDLELVALSSYLEAGRQRDLAVHAYITAALSRPPTATIEYIDVMRRHGTPANADKLVLGVLSGRPVHVVGILGKLREAGRAADAEKILALVTQGSSELAGSVARELLDAQADQDAAQVFQGIAARPLVELAAALASLSASSTAQVTRLDAYLRDRSPHEFIDAVSVLRTAKRDPEADLLFAALGRGRPIQVCTAVLALSQSGRPQEALNLLEAFGVQARPDEAVEAMSLLAETGDGARAAGDLLVATLAVRSDPAAILSILRQVRDSEQTDRFLEHLGATLNVPDLVTLAANLATRGCRPEADLILSRAAGRDDFAELRDAFHEAGHHAQAYRLAERRGEF
jgi:hypothetical protein